VPPTPQPAPPVPPAPPAPPAPAPTTVLRVSKIAPRVARLGDRIFFRLRVTNVGTVTATDVVLADRPSAALTLTALEATSRPRIVRGDALWRIGTLAPGASRIVRGRVTIKSGTPGLKRNLAAAVAGNAGVAAAIADTRVRRPRAPRVTG
jgi:uncharacterized repeat protein (TIGR01451 family)